MSLLISLPLQDEYKYPSPPPMTCWYMGSDIEPDATDPPPEPLEILLDGISLPPFLGCEVVHKNVPYSHQRYLHTIPEKGKCSYHRL